MSPLKAKTAAMKTTFRTKSLHRLRKKKKKKKSQHPHPSLVEADSKRKEEAFKSTALPASHGGRVCAPDESRFRLAVPKL